MSEASQEPPKLTPEAIRATENQISAALIRISARSSFFATLALFARFQVSNKVPTAATDGRKIYVNPQFFAPLTPAQRDGLILHEVLHDALLHVTRRGSRDPKLWNIAADIVINGIILRDGWALPEGGLRDISKEHLATEEVYDLLLRQAEKVEIQVELQDLLDPNSGDGDDKDNDRDGQESEAKARKAQKGTAGEGKDAIEADWRNALEQAKQVAKSSAWGKLHGNLPGGMARELAQLQPAKLDWRSYLWRYLTQTPTDFSGFDRRFVYQSVYLEAIAGESVRVQVAVDTSGSIDNEAVVAFVSEVRAILEAYPHLKCDLCYADTQIYGPYALTRDSHLPPPEGGGGTDFRPFFDHINQNTNVYETQVAIYLTDGWGDFPEQAPSVPTLWVVLPGGRDLEHFPFGETVRLSVSE